MIKKSKGFTLIELIVVMAILAILVTLAAPKFLGQTEKAHQTKLLNDAKVLEDACTMYYLDNNDWPRVGVEDVDFLGDEDLTNNMYTLSDGFKTPAVLEAGAHYYDIDMNLLKPYINNFDSDSNNFVLQNPVGTVYILETELNSRLEGYVAPNPVFDFGDNITGVLKLTTGELVISGTGPMNDFPGGTSPIYSDCALIKSITINSGVTSIGDYAFAYCSALTSVTIPSSVTSIGVHAFYNCSSLPSVVIPSSVTSIEESAFQNCTLLTSITISSSVTFIGKGAFQNCTLLTSVVIPSSVTSIGVSAFNLCTSLTSVTIPSSVTSIGAGAFYNCTSLTSITIPSSVTFIGWGAFYFCTSLTSIINNANINQEIDADAFITNATATRTASAYEANLNFINAVTAAGYTVTDL